LVIVRASVAARRIFGMPVFLSSKTSPKNAESFVVRLGANDPP
jgi:hypothetical protein